MHETGQMLENVQWHQWKPDVQSFLQDKQNNHGGQCPVTGGKRACPLQAEVANRNGHIPTPDPVYSQIFDEVWQMLCP